MMAKSFSFVLTMTPISDHDQAWPHFNQQHPRFTLTSDTYTKPTQNNIKTIPTNPTNQTDQAILITLRISHRRRWSVWRPWRATWRMSSKQKVRIVNKVFDENYDQHFSWESRTTFLVRIADKSFCRESWQKVVFGNRWPKVCHTWLKGQRNPDIIALSAETPIFKNWQNRDNVQICSSLAWALGTCNKIWKIILEPL